MQPPKLALAGLVSLATLVGATLPLKPADAYSIYSCPRYNYRSGSILIQYKGSRPQNGNRHYQIYSRYNRGRLVNTQSVSCPGRI